MMRCEDGPDRTGLPDTPRLAFADQTAGFEATDRPHGGNATDNRLASRRCRGQAGAADRQHRTP